MSRSIHTTKKDVKGLTMKQADEQLTDPDSDLRVLARKSLLKESVKKIRKIKNPDDNLTNNFKTKQCLKIY